MKQDEQSISEAISHSQLVYGAFGGQWVFCLDENDYEQYGQHVSSAFEDLPNEDMVCLAPDEFNNCSDWECEVFEIGLL